MLCGEFHTTYASDMGIFDTRRARWVLIAFIVALFSIPFVAGSYLHGRIVPTQVDPEVAKLQEPHTGKPFQILVESVVPMNRFAFRWHPTPGANPPGMLTTIVLDQENGGTRVTASQSGFETLPADMRQHVLERTASGYKTVVENLKKLMEGKPHP